MCTFAGKTASSVAMLKRLPSRRVRGCMTASPPAISAPPLAYTSARLAGSWSGTIASYVRGITKCMTPAKTKKRPNERALRMVRSLWRRSVGARRLRCLSPCGRRERRPAGASLFVRAGRPPLLLAARLALLRARVASSGGSGRTRRPARSRRRERGGEPGAQPLQRQLTVARLAACVLRDGCHPRAGALDQPRLLRVAQHARGGHVEDRLDARGGHVR